LGIFKCSASNRLTNRSKDNEKKAQEYYMVAHHLFTKLGAKKDLEKIENAWTHDRLSTLENQGQSDITIAIQR
jgi:hypothetical protein